MMLKKRRLSIAVILAFITSLICLKYVSRPYVWIAIVWVIVVINGTVSSKKSSIKALWFNVGIMIITFGMFESYLWLQGNPRDKLQYKYPLRYFTRHEFLGYAPQKNVTNTVSRYDGDELLYRVPYTTDSNGLRRGPPSHGRATNAECVLFFGDSFTFGEGVPDDETMPYRVGQQSNGRYHTYNFGFHGYGPHQMLVILEHKLEEDIIDCKPTVAVYQAIPGHVLRAVGRLSWDTYGPRYVLQRNGHVRFAGHFHNIVVAEVITQLTKSLIIQRILNRQWSQINRDDVDLFLGIVDTARDVFENRYSGSTFHVIFWSNWDHIEGIDDAILLEGLYRRNVRVHIISDILPNYDIDKQQYRISEHDRHPNALAHKLIAEYVLKHILGQ